MKLKVIGAKVINQISAERRRSTSSINQTHPDTAGWKLELTDNGLLCTMRDGALKLIPLTNVIELEVEEAVAPTLATVKKAPKSAAKKAR